VNENVLLIGHETPFMETLSERIKSHQFTVHFARDGSEALEIVRGEDIEVVVLNIKDLDAEGMHMLDSMKRDCPLAECITLTSPSTIHWSIEGMKRGVFADLLIPFDIENLVARVREALIKRKARKRKKKRSLLGTLGDLMVSATFAESGDVETARQILSESREPEPDSQRGQEDERTEGIAGRRRRRVR
jgi:DNA-binding NtrC family response regulator